MAALRRTPDPLRFSQIDRLLKRELGAVYASYADKEVAQNRVAMEAIQGKEEESPDMGLFDHLAEKGVDVKDIPLDPFNIPDGTYKVVLAEIELAEPKDDGWPMQLKIHFQVHNSEGKEAGKEKIDFKSIPTASSWERNPEGSKGALDSTVQRLYQLGLTEDQIQNLNVLEMNNELRGTIYLVDLVTSTKDVEPGKRKPQYVNNVRALTGSGGVSSDLDI